MLPKIRKLSCVLLLVTIFSLNSCFGAKILAVFPTASKSHWLLGQPLMRELVRAGHEVTVMSPFPVKNPPKNYRHIEMKASETLFEKKVDESFDEVDDNPLVKIKEMFQMSNTIVYDALREPQVVGLLQSNETFDLLFLEIFLDDALLGLAHHYKCPVVAMSTMGATKWIIDMVGSPSPISYVPSKFLPFTDRMSFFERLANLLYHILEEALMQIYFYRQQSQIYDEYFANPKPPLDELRRSAVSVALLNSHFSLSFPRPYLPGMVEVGGMQIEHKPTPLPADLKQFFEGATYGVIYFSMGGNLKPSKMPKDKQDAILKGLAARKEKVILKWDDLEATRHLDRSKFYTSNWLPQSDILAHPNTKVFITHGGLLGSTEAVFHGVPVVGIPIFGDQKLNMARAVLSGWGVRVDYSNLTEASFRWGLEEVLSNPSYEVNMKLVQQRYHDQPIKPLELAKFWVEYVLRNKGAEHIKSHAQQLNFIQYHGLDLIGFLVAVIFGMPLIICRLCGCCKRKPTKQKRN